MRKTPCAIFFSLTLFVFSSAAQQPPPRDPQAIALLQQALVALGGPNSGMVNDAQIEGTMTSLANPRLPPLSFVAKARGKDRSFVLSSSNEVTSYKLFRGNGLAISGGRTAKLQPFQMRGVTLDIVPVWMNLWNDFTKAEATVQMSGTSDPGASCVVVENPDGLQHSRHLGLGRSELCLDSTSGLVTRIVFKAVHGPYLTDVVTIENRYENYQTVDGILVPMKITRSMGGKPLSVLNVTSARFNIGLQDADFSF